MSQIDVHNAKRALATRLQLWGLEGDTFKLAAGFIDDLVEQGWQMAAFRETRPQPPLVGEACQNCGRALAVDCCDNPLRQATPTPAYSDHAARARESLRALAHPIPHATTTPEETA